MMIKLGIKKKLIVNQKPSDFLNSVHQPHYETFYFGYPTFNFLKAISVLCSFFFFYSILFMLHGYTIFSYISDNIIL